MLLNKEIIESLSYTDFVGLINQWNVLPGSFTTLSKWINYSDINSTSNILEIACTTGFSSREISILTGCRGIGIDISQNSIEAALENQRIYSPNPFIKYFKEDAYNFTSDEKFSHIIVGAGLKFFPDQTKIIDKIVSLLDDGGYLLASPFYTIDEIPGYLVEKARKIFGIQITTESYKEIMKIYNNFEIIYEDRLSIIQETKEEIEYYAKCTIDRIVSKLNIKDESVYKAMFNRLVDIKTMSNELRPYQNYTVLILRYRRSIYPNRFIELF